MWESPDVIIASDSHLAAERGQGLFRADTELAEFLNWILKEIPGPCHLVLAGDILDYLAANSPDPERAAAVLNPSRAVERTHAIVDHHEEVFRALADLAQSKHHHLIWISGNHDPELALTEVQQALESRLNSFSPQPRLNWLVHGEAARFKVGEAKILVEHGDLFDDWNRIDRAGLRKALARISRGLSVNGTYEPPPGTQLAVKCISHLRTQYPWVETLKPERETVIPLLYAFLPKKEQFELLRELRIWLPMLRRSFVTTLLREWDQGAFVRHNGRADSRRNRFKQWLSEEERQLRISQPSERSLEKLIPKLRRVSAEDGYFEIESADSNAEDVAFLLSQGCDLIVHGHTHAAKAYRLGESLYMNSGTWTRLLRLPPSQASDSDWLSFLNGLAQGKDLGTLLPTFVRVKSEAGTEQTSAKLMGWESRGPTLRAAWSFEATDCAWGKEAEQR